MITQSRLKQMLEYDPDTGQFVRVDTHETQVRRLGEVAGSVQKNGYVRVGVDGRYYYAHRLAFLYVVGKWPNNQIDHKNRDRADNRWENIRPATSTQNAANSTCRNKHGLKGIAFRPERNKKPWSAGITREGKRCHLGYFATADEAHEAYAAAQLSIHGEYAS